MCWVEFEVRGSTVENKTHITFVFLLVLLQTFFLICRIGIIRERS